LDNIKSLLKDDPSWVFRKAEQDMTGLANAALKGRKSVPELLLAHNADINSQMRALACSGMVWQQGGGGGAACASR
jgi:hypothetical protein